MQYDSRGKLNNPNIEYPIHINEGELIGTIEEVKKETLIEDIETWNWTSEIRTEKIISELKIDENDYLSDKEKQIVKTVREIKSNQ